MQNKFFGHSLQLETEKVNITIEFCIRISLGTKFRIKLTIFIFWTKFIQKGSGLKQKYCTFAQHGSYLLY